MKTSSGITTLAALGLLVVALAFAPGPTPVRAAAPGLEKERAAGEQLVKTLHITEALGPLAPVALSPFFALACLSGASLLSDSGLLPDAISKNAFIGSGSALNNGFVFAGLLALSLLTAAPKLTKVTKPFAQAIDQIEGHAGIVSVVAVQMLSQMQLGEPEVAQATVVYQAGVIAFSTTTLLAAFSAINLFVVNTVKFFFEVLTFLSPFPGVDAVFEAMNKAFAAFLVAIYLISPWLATVVNLIIFGICLVIFAWVYRRVIYLRSVLGDPVLGWLAEAVFRRERVTPISTPLPRKIATALPNASLVLKAFAGRGVREVKRKTRGYLVRSGDRLHFAVPRLLRAPVIVAFPSAGHRASVSKGLLSNSISVVDDSGDVAVKVVFTRRYNAILGAIRELVGEKLVEEETVPVGPRNMVQISREVAKAVKGDGRETLRAELA